MRIYHVESHLKPATWTERELKMKHLLASTEQRHVPLLINGDYFKTETF